jgi:hypothetical protein
MYNALYGYEKVCACALKIFTLKEDEQMISKFDFQKDVYETILDTHAGA